MTNPIVLLSELSDEPSGENADANSPRLDAVLTFLPKYPGVRVRVADALCNAGIFSLASLCLQKRKEMLCWKNLGKKSIGDLESTLALFGLTLADTPTSIVVPDQARPIDAHVQQLQRWIENGLARCEAEERRLKDLDVVSRVERRILTNVMLILDGREPSTMPEGEVSNTQDRVKRARIQLSLRWSDGRRSEITETFNVLPAMLESAEDLLHTLTTGERPPPKGLYELCAKAFGTTREDAKERLCAAAYGMDKQSFDARNRPA